MLRAKNPGLHFNTALGCLLVCLGACQPTETAPGGLEAEDFTQISMNGFDAADNEVDKNDYAWSMAYLLPDGAAEGHLYVGTGNDLIGAVYDLLAGLLAPADAQDASTLPPEIRRYRPDQCQTCWETVLDYRDVETDPDFSTVGFRSMAVYRASSDAVNYLYAATKGASATVWRSATGEPGSWESVFSSEEFGSVRMMAEHNGLLYLAIYQDNPFASSVGQIWATDGDAFWPVIEDGFGNPDNDGVMSLISWLGYLWAGTSNPSTGYEIWKLEGLDGAEPVQIVVNGGPSSLNEKAMTPCLFQNKLYWGNMISPHLNTLHRKAADIIRIHEDDHWETVIGPDSISGYDSGFDHWPNGYIWSMVVHEGWLYAATYDQISGWFNVLDNMGRAIRESLSRQRVANPIEQITSAGADLYKTQDGITWYPVTVAGFDDVGNYGFRVMESVDDQLFIGTANPFDGLEMWVGERSAP